MQERKAINIKEFASGSYFQRLTSDNIIIFDDIAKSCQLWNVTNSNSPMLIEQFDNLSMPIHHYLTQQGPILKKTKCQLEMNPLDLIAHAINQDDQPNKEFCKDMLDNHLRYWVTLNEKECIVIVTIMVRNRNGLPLFKSKIYLCESMPNKKLDVKCIARASQKILTIGKLSANEFLISTEEYIIELWSRKNEAEKIFNRTATFLFNSFDGNRTLPDYLMLCRFIYILPNNLVFCVFGYSIGINTIKFNIKRGNSCFGSGIKAVPVSHVWHDISSINKFKSISILPDKKTVPVA